MDVHTKEQRSRNMRAIKSSGTSIELRLRKALWEKGYRYRINNKKIFGRPDITFLKKKIAIFCDSDYFHGKDWERVREKIGTNREFWINKIEGNMQRDRLVNQTLKEQGWTVLRYWGTDIKKDTEGIVKEIERYLK